MMAELECRQCGTLFPKPATRGRPPIRCMDCRGLNKPISSELTPIVRHKMKSANGLYSRLALINFLKKNGQITGSQNIANILRGLDE